MDEDRISDTILQDELRRLNRHLPRNRRTVRELLAEDTPEVFSVGGERLVLRKDEIEALTKDLPDDILGRVKLPFVLLRQGELGNGAFTLLGEVDEEYVLAKVLGVFQGTLADFRLSRESVTVFYKSQISELMRCFHSLVVIGFRLSD